MTHTLSFRNLESLDHLRDFVDGYLDQTIGQIAPNKPLTANVVVEKKSVKGNSHGHPDFVCEIVLHHPSVRNSIVARKASPNFYQSVKEACRAVEKSLRRISQTRGKRRHRNFERANHLEHIIGIKEGSEE